MSATRPLRIAIDARLDSGRAGGIETVVVGLAAGLSAIEDGDEDYVFLTREDGAPWLAPYLTGRARLLPVRGNGTSSLSSKVATTWPSLRRIWRRIPSSRFIPEPGPPWSDGSVERAGVDVLHLPLQSGFLSSIPSIYHPHDLQHVHLPEYFTARERAHREIWYRRLCEQSAYVCVTSSWARRDVTSHFGLPDEKVVVIPWAPGTDVFPAPSLEDIVRVRERWSIAQPFVLYPAQTWPHKNHRGLLEAMARLRDDRGLRVMAVFPGRRTEHAGALEALTRELQLSEQVKWLGFVSALELACLYRLAHAAVIPSLFEAASFPVWEAFSCGVPTASSNVTSLPEQVGDAAILFDPRDGPSIADALERIWVDEGLRRLLVRRGRQRVTAFSWTRTARTFRALYRRVGRRPLDDADRSLLGAAPEI